MRKKCTICNKYFKTTNNMRKYCSFDCRCQSNKNRYREKPNGATWFSIVEFINERDFYKCTEQKSI
jgi:predicted nucleic acid-binding Zn ribbon protein